MQPKKKSVVETSVIFEGETNPLVSIFEDMEIKSIGYMRVPNKNTFASYVVTSKGEKILKIEVDEPNLRPIAEESAKIHFVSNFCNDMA